MPGKPSKQAVPKARQRLAKALIAGATGPAGFGGPPAAPKIMPAMAPPMQAPRPRVGIQANNNLAMAMANRKPPGVV